MLNVGLELSSGLHVWRETVPDGLFGDEEMVLSCDRGALSTDCYGAINGYGGDNLQIIEDDHFTEIEVFDGSRKDRIDEEMVRSPAKSPIVGVWIEWG